MKYIRVGAFLGIGLVLVSFGFAAALDGVPASMPALPDDVTADIEVHANEVVREISPQFIGTNLTQYKTDKTQARLPETLERVRGLGIRTVRFPNGCFADLYNWQKPKPDEMTVEDFLDFCDAIGAEPYYTLNMQGGTEGREGAPPAGAPPEEVIKYRHLGPNPCGYTKYYFGTLPESLALFQKYTIDRALAGKTPILHYELGNENWGQARTDWIPPVYGKNAEVWCEAIRSAWSVAQGQHAKLKDLRLWIVAVGFPTMGNNQDPLKAPDREINRAWTAQINRLADGKLIDAVNEHFYPFPSNVGDSLYWTVHNLHNLLALRAGAANERLAGYRDDSLAYHVPIEVTEWNLKCWGTHRVRWDLPLVNPGFEKGLAGWEVTAGSDAGARATPAAARRGKLGLELHTSPDAPSVQVKQTIAVGDRPKSAAFGAYLWVRTPTPRQVQISIKEVGVAPNGKGVPERLANQTNMWERFAVMIQPTESARQIELTIRLSGPGAAAFIDEIQPAHWETFSDNIPPSADRYEQQLFAVDAVREMLGWPITRTHWHHLFGNYPCPQLAADGKQRDNAVPFQLLAGRIGKELVRTRCFAPSFSYNTTADAIATDFNAVTPDVQEIPALSAVATRDGKRIYLLMINRTTDRRIAARIRFRGSAPPASARVHVMTGEDLDLAGARLDDRDLAVGELDRHEVPPLSAEIIEMTLPVSP